ncbi:MAG: neutral/alkaline non-lysosomal ceramidase N-terminal domain-containing protein [Chthoniobacter sp.]|uniref:neutral/alkaline non-lysosomal ceramidase N-terminal domain-containing protein n=1 Tax=Chthoniobacter sp. TaxID=2510640 RepID=UPI0032AD7327
MNTPLTRFLRLFSLLFVAAISASAQDFKVGVGRADITPTEPVRLGGYASRTKPSSNVDARLFAKALAIRDSTGATTLIITADTIGTPRWFNDELATRLEQELKIDRAHFLFCCSHSHSSPVVHGALTEMYGLDESEAKATEKYTLFFLDQSVEAAKSAVKDLEPAALSFGRSEAFFAGNRRQFGPKGVGFGINPNGLVDRDVPVLRAVREDRTTKAILFGYACHCTTAGPNDEISPDWAGYAEEELEHTYTGATALFITGCGADANPNPRGSLALAHAHGLQLAGAVARALSEPMLTISGPISAAFDRVDLPVDKTPDRAYYEAKLLEKPPATQRYAQRFLDRIARGEPLATSYPAPVQVLRFGNSLTLIALSGEVVADYSSRLKRELPGERLWNAGYCNDVFAYVPSMRILTEGGYEADASIIYYGLPTRFAPAIEDTLINKVLDLVKRTGGTVPAPAKK